MSKATADLNPVPGHAEPIPDLTNELDVKEAQLEVDVEFKDTGDAVLAAGAYDGPVVERKELWAYYLYYNGDVSPLLSVCRALCGAERLSCLSQNGVGPNGYSMTLFQSLATAAGPSRLVHPSSCPTPSSSPPSRL